ncbi:MAG: VWA domain-containing protein [Dehalococcoidales bacterium]|nr:VWA domain-containing protein [Dehalococcoidales bacterium]
MNDHVFPFTAIVGQERVKTALILSVINPRVGGVLISGGNGTAKSTLVRGLADIVDDMKIVNLPLNITEDRLVGGLDFEGTINHGRKCHEPGLLQRAHGNILYIDEVNLLNPHIADLVLDVAASGINIVEREGVTLCHRSRFILIATMNPEEGHLRPQLLDRFGLSVTAYPEAEEAKRAEIIRRRLEFERDPVAFRQKWLKESRSTAQKILRARETLREVNTSGEILALAAATARGARCAGHRAEITIIETAKALAAFKGRGEVTTEEIEEAAGYVLPHRAREPLSGRRKQEVENGSDGPPENAREGNVVHLGYQDNLPQKEPEQDIPPFFPAGTQHGKAGQEKVEAPALGLSLRIEGGYPRKARRFTSSGRQEKSRANVPQGRYVSFRIPRGKVNDLALDATLRAAALFQKMRRRTDGLTIVIEPQDIREKVREQHTSTFVLFVVDASGSMGARRRMGAVKGTVISMLRDMYLRRNQVGVIAFRRDSAIKLLEATRSVELAERCLKDLPTGGRTPLAAGLRMAYVEMKLARTRDPDILPYLVLVSDGRANVPLFSRDSLADALEIASRIRAEGIRSLVLDTEEGAVRLGIAKTIAEVLDARYVRLDEISPRKVLVNVESLMTSTKQSRK